MNNSSPDIVGTLRTYYRTMAPLYFETLIDTSQFQISYNSIADRDYYNCAHALKNDDICTIEEIEHFFKKRKRESCVYIDPCSPPPLKKLLESRGYKEDASELEVWYSKCLEKDIPIEIQRHIKVSLQRLSIETVSPESLNMNLFWKIDATCNQISNALVNFFRERAQSCKSHKKNGHYFFLGRLDKVPAVTGAVSICGPHAFFSEAAVLPKYRRLGLYSTMLMYCIDFSRKLGCTHAFVNCDVDAFSNQACLKTGFNAFFRRNLFRRK